MMHTVRKPNVVFVLTDDQGYGDLGCTGNTIVRTPNIDKFYDDCIRFTQFHVGPVCAPTRAGLMTGHYANSTGVWHTYGGRSLLRKDEWTLASALKENGYRTGIFGKWHLGDEYPYRPHDRGFETAIVHGGGGVGQTPDYWGNDYFNDTYSVNGQHRKFKGYCTDVFFQQALRFIEANRETPFFCYIAPNAPHTPLNVEKKYSDLYRDKTNVERAQFYGMITNIDENFGMLRQNLVAWNLEDRTILVFMTDNGTRTGVTVDTMQFVVDGFNYGMRGRKTSEYDGGHRVPFFIRWPEGNLEGGKDIDELTANVDFMPTILDLCDVPTKEGKTFHGRSIKPLIEGKQEWEERALVTDSQRNSYPAKWRRSAVMTNKWRLVNGRELYDIKADQEQRYDVAENYPHVVANLRAEYEKWWEIVSRQYDEMIPLLIGRKSTTLTSHDMRNEEGDVAYSQGQIRRGKSTGGYWEIEVEEDGIYQFALRRWPASENRPISSGIDGDDIYFERENILEENWYFYTGGNALPVREAFISIGGTIQSNPVSADESVSVFKVGLKKGQTTLQAWFGDGKKVITSAYYVDVVCCRSLID
jgi:arylsulfatase A-like enzyme